MFSKSGGEGREGVSCAGRGFSGGSRRFRGVSLGSPIERFGTRDRGISGVIKGSACVDSVEGMATMSDRTANVENY